MDQRDSQESRPTLVEKLERCQQELIDAKRSATIFKAICEAAPVGLFFTDPIGHNVYTNPTNLNQMGMTIEEAVGTGWQRAIHPEDRERVFQEFGKATEKGLLYRGDNRYLRRDGSVVEVSVKAAGVDIDGEQVGYIGVAEDITTEEQIRRHRSQAERLESIGRLAGGIAHDFNNLLTVIMGFAELIDDDSRNKSSAAEILQAARKARELTSQLLAFARRQMTTPVVFNALDGLRELRTTLRRLLSEDIEISFLLQDHSSPFFMIDPTQFQRLILNLAANAGDSMPNGGKLTIEVSPFSVDAEERLQLHEIEPGEYVQISITDDGSGMAPETVGRIFEPFYTTKEDQGTGLGLATCYGIVRQAGGYIWVSSAPGAGSTFKMFFPQVEPPSASALSERSALTPVQGGHETVLLIEDEPQLQKLQVRALEKLGYHVYSAANGEEAVSVASEIAHLDVIVSDVVMPLLSGPDAVARIRQSHPEISVLYVSGYTQGELVQTGLSESGVAFLPKPYTPLELARRIRRLLTTQE